MSPTGLHSGPFFLGLWLWPSISRGPWMVKPWRTSYWRLMTLWTRHFKLTWSCLGITRTWRIKCLCWPSRQTGWRSSMLMRRPWLGLGIARFLGFGQPWQLLKRRKMRLLLIKRGFNKKLLMMYIMHMRRASTIAFGRWCTCVKSLTQVCLTSTKMSTMGGWWWLTTF